MKLTQFTDFGLRILMYLSYENRQQPVKIIEMAEQFNIPRNHLIKVVNKLAKLGWVETSRGRYGGVKLAIDPQALKIGLVVRELEESLQLIDCDAGPCAFTLNCGVKSILDRALVQFMRELNQYTLADVVQGKTRQEIKHMHLSYIATDA
ncbi:BadM/Rrf2 family transcriptional regulator ['Osedax' symbiont bacterium Rs2_46_30_T18]|nr:BadM/Rrf2 family transcriptional regulator ['Osedax' symbiont bacterium Rs2_46_30_T18]